MVELAVGERETLGLAGDEADPTVECCVVREPRACAVEHRGALVEPDDRTSVPAHECLGDESGARRDVEDPVVRAGLDSLDHRPAPARILPEAQYSRDTVVVPRKPGEQLESVALALALTSHVPTAHRAHSIAPTPRWPR